MLSGMPGREEGRGQFRELFWSMPSENCLRRCLPRNFCRCLGGRGRGREGERGGRIMMANGAASSASADNGIKSKCITMAHYFRGRLLLWVRWRLKRRLLVSQQRMQISSLGNPRGHQSRDLRGGACWIKLRPLSTLPANRPHFLHFEGEPLSAASTGMLRNFPGILGYAQ